MNELKETVSEYKIGHTTYIVKTVFNPTFQQSLSDILKRLIVREIELSNDNEENNRQAV